MRKRARFLITLTMLALGIVLTAFIPVQTAYETRCEWYPKPSTKRVIARRVLWPWRERWSFDWIPSRSSSRSVRTVESAIVYGWLRQPSKRYGWIFDSFEGAGCSPVQ
jgi:hypothetical protein